MQITADPDLEKVAEFMQSHLDADKLVPVAAALANIAPALWGHYQPQEMRALSLRGEPILAYDPHRQLAAT